MNPVLATHEEPLTAGEVVDRPNRFVLRVAIEGATDRAYLADPGQLAFLRPGVSVLCSPADDPERATNWDAVAAELEDIFVSLKASLANRLFLEAFRSNLLPNFEAYQYVASEPQYPSDGRADFLLEPPSGGHDVYIEVKSCTHEENGIGKFPDRQTKRGRRHLRSLEAIAAEGGEAHVVFVAQHPGIDAIEPYREVDPEFASLLSDVAAAGVGVHGIGTEFDPPAYRLLHPDLPIYLD